MKNYYDELEVSKTASKEIIEKVYKILAKKYHPDTTTDANKQVAEEKFKVISEAYEILSNDEKRKKYDLELKQSNPTISYTEYINVVKQRDDLSKTLNDLKKQLYGYKNQNNTNQQYNYNRQYEDFYKQTNSNFKNSVHENHQNASQNYTNFQNKVNHTMPKTPSIFNYYIRKLKEFIFNIVLLIFSILASILIINIIFNF